MKQYAGILIAGLIMAFIIYTQYKTNSNLQDTIKNLETTIQKKDSELCKLKSDYESYTNSKQQVNLEKQEDIFNEKNSDTNSLVDNFTNRLHLIQKDSM